MITKINLTLLTLLFFIQGCFLQPRYLNTRGLKNLTDTTNDNITDGIGNNQSFVRITSPLEYTSSQFTIPMKGECARGVDVHVTGDLINPAAVTCQEGLFQFDVGLYGTDGEKIIVVKQFGENGQIIAQDEIFYIKDTKPPYLEILSPKRDPIAIIDGQLLTITGRCEVGAAMEFNGPGQTSPIKQICVETDFSQIVFLKSGDGLKALEISATDSAGNITKYPYSVQRKDGSGGSNPDGSFSENNLAFISPQEMAFVQKTFSLSVKCNKNVQVVIGGDAQPSTQPCPEQGNFSTQVNLLGEDGLKEIELIQVKDNRTLTVKRSFVLDSLAPFVQINSPLANTEHSAALNLVGTCETGIEVQISGDIQNAQILPCTNGSFSTSLTLQDPAGEKTVQASQTDFAGNTANVNRIFKKVVSQPNTPDNRRRAALTVLEKYCFVCHTNNERHFNYQTDQEFVDNGWVVPQDIEKSLTRRVQFYDGNPNGTPNMPTGGPNAAEFSQADYLVLKNWVLNMPTTPANGEVDPLKLRFLTPAALTSTQQNLAITGQCNLGFPVLISGDLSQALSIPCPQNETFQIQIPLSGLDGPKTIILEQKNGLQTASASRTFLKDNTAPNIKIDNPLANAEHHEGLTIEGSCEAGLDVQLSGDIMNPRSINCNGGYIAAIIFTEPEGNKTIEVAQTDLAGNAANDSRVYRHVTQVILEPANLRFLTPLAQSAFNSAFPITATCNPGVQVNIMGDVQAVPVSIPCPANGNLNATIQLAGADGLKTVILEQVYQDTRIASSREFFLDTQNPMLTITSPAVGFKSVQSINLSGNCESGLQVLISGDTAAPKTALCVNGQFLIEIELSANLGNKTINATQIDLAGNQAMDDRVFERIDEIQLDLNNISFLSPQSGTQWKQTFPITGNCNIGVPIELLGDLTNPRSVQCSAAGTFQAEILLSGNDGNKNITIRQTYQTQMVEKSRGFVKDTNPPLLTVDEPPAGTSHHTGLTLQGICENGLPVFVEGDISNPQQVNCNGNFSVAILFSETLGEKTVRLSQTDLAGNIGIHSKRYNHIEEDTPTTRRDAALTVLEKYCYVCHDGGPRNLKYQTDAEYITSGYVVPGNIEQSLTRRVQFYDGNPNGIPNMPTGGPNAAEFSEADYLVLKNWILNMPSTGNLPLDPSQLTFTDPVALTSTQDIINITGTCNPSIQVNIRGDISNNADVECPANGIFNASVNLVGVDGTKQVNLIQTKGLQTASVNRNFIKDNLSPVISINDPTANTEHHIGVNIQGICEANLLVQLTGDLKNPRSINCNGFFATDIEFTEPIGNKTINVIQVDAAGNQGQDSRIFKHIDEIILVPNKLAFQSPPANTMSQQVINIVGTCNANVNINITGDIAPPLNIPCPSNEMFSADVNLTGNDGAKLITLTQMHMAQQVSAARQFEKDTLAPVITITSPAVNAPTIDGHTITGTCEVASRVNLTGDLLLPVDVDCINGNYSAAIVFTAANGTKIVNVSQTDGAGNNTQISRNFQKVEALNENLLTFTSPIENSLNQIQLQVTGTCNPQAQVEIKGDILIQQTLPCTNNNFTANVSLSAVDGTKLIRIEQTYFGETIFKTRNVIRDTTPPSLTINSPDANAQHHQGLTIQGSCESGLNVLVAGDITNAGSTPCDGNYTRAVLFTEPEGMKTITVTQIDGATNSTTVNRAYEHIREIILVPGNLTFTSPAQLSAHNSKFNLTGTCNPDAQVQISGDVQNVQSVVCTNGQTFGATIELSGADGEKVVEISQNYMTQTISATRRFLKDTAPPNLAIQLPQINSQTFSDLTISGTCESGLSVNISGDIDQNESVNCVNGIFSQLISLSGLAGTKNVVVAQIDSAGNSSQDNRDFLKVQALDPATLTFTDPSENSVFQNNVTIIGTCDNRSQVAISGDIVTPLNLACSGSGVFNGQISLSGNDGLKTITAQQTLLGQSISKPLNLLKDNTAPNLTIAAPAVNTAHHLGLTISGSCEPGYQVSLSGDITNPGNTNCNGTYSYDLTFTEPIGIKNIIVEQVDGVGNRSTINRNFNHSLQFPLIATKLDFAAPAENAFVQASITLAGICNANINVDISGDITANTSVACPSGETFSTSINLSPGDGAKIIRITQTSEGQTIFVERTFHLDTMAPVLAFISPAENTESLLNLSINGSCENGLQVFVTGDISQNKTVNCTANTFTTDIDLNAAAGTKNVIIAQTDSAGNTGQANRNFIKASGLNPNALLINTPTANSSFQDLVNVTGTCNQQTEVIIRGDINNPSQVNCSATGTFTTNISLAGTDGNKQVVVEQIYLGQTINKSVNLIKDNLAPAIAITVPAVNTGHATGLTVSGSCENSLQVVFTGDLTNPGNVNCNGTFSYFIEFTQPEGNKTIRVSQTDLAGNSATDSRVFVHQPDIVLIPTKLAFTSPAANSQHQTNLTITGTCNAGVNVRLSGNIIGSPTVQCPAGETFSTAVQLVGSDGAKNVVIRQQFAGQNISQNRDFIKDTSPPALAITAPAANFQTDEKLTLIGTCEPGIQVSIAGDVDAPSTTTCNAGNFSTEISLSANTGFKNVTVSQTDQAGNNTLTNRTFERINPMALDPNKLVLIGPLEGSSHRQNFLITGECNEETTVIIRGEIRNIRTVNCTNGRFAASILLAGADGPKNVIIEQTFMGTTINKTLRFIKDTVTPVLTIDSPAENTAHAIGLTLTGQCEAGLQVNIIGDITNGQNVNCDGTYSFQVIFSEPVENKTVRVSQTDAAGNRALILRIYNHDDSVMGIMSLGLSATNAPALRMPSSEDSKFSSGVRLAARKYIFDTFIEIFGNQLAQEFEDNILKQQDIFGGPCDPHSNSFTQTLSGKAANNPREECVDQNNPQANNIGHTNVFRSGLIFKTCHAAVNDSQALTYALNKIFPDNPVLDPTQKDISKAYELFFPGETIGQDSAQALMDVASEVVQSNEKWKYIFLSLCLAPGWQSP